MILTDNDILAAFEWCKPNEIQTKRGPRILRKAPATPAAKTFWEANKPQLSAAGITFGLKWKSQTEFEYCWWQAIPQAVVEQRAKNEELSRATDNTTLFIPAPDGLDYLGYQRAGIAFAQDKEGTLFGDEMGLGKTIQAIGLINSQSNIHRILIICPVKLKLNWYRELRKWLTRELSIGIAEGDCFPSTDIVIINYEILHKFPNRLDFFWDLVCVDEAHLIKNRKARRTKCIVGYKPGRDEDASEAKSGIPCKRRLALTGTPMPNEREELWPLIQWLQPTVFNNWWTFCRKLSNEDAQKMLRANVMIRRLKKEVLKELPPKRRQIIPLPADLQTSDLLRRENAEVSRWEERITQLEAEVELAKADSNDERYQAAVRALKEGCKAKFSEIAIIRHETALAKVPMVKSFVEDMLEEKDKIIVLAYHRDVIEQLHKAFEGVGALKIYGGMSTTESQRAVDLFQNDPNHKVIILQIMVAVGMTLTAASDVVAAEQDWVPANMSQAEDRAHRIGQTDSVNVYHLVLEGSIDINMVQTLVDKQNLIDATLDNPAAQKEISEEPITPFSYKKINVKREQIAKEAEKMTDRLVGLIHSGLKMVATKCNGAVSWDAMGFSKIDTRIGHELANALMLSKKQAVLGKRLLQKYRKQLPEDLVNQLAA